MKVALSITSATSLCLLPIALAAEGDDIAEVMIGEGAAPAQAACIVEKLGDDARRIFTAEDEDLSDEDEQIFLAAMDACSDVDAGE